jgi:phosphatidylglycerol:prolipoprotein diacylglycerol transferase
MMQRELLHIYGPFSIYSYGLFIALGLLLFLWLIRRHPQFKELNLEEHFNIILITSIITGIFGGRLLYALTEPGGVTSLADFFAYWQGGFSILGCILAICAMLPPLLNYLKIPILPFLDLISIYAPLLQSISRIGCLCAGCCYGVATRLPWAILYTDVQSIAPLNVYIHPTQLYNSLALLGIFSLQYFVLQRLFTKNGQLFCSYLALVSLQRFIIDFWRDDRTFFDSRLFMSFSVNQWVALTIIISASLAFLSIRAKK